MTADIREAAAEVRRQREHYHCRQGHQFPKGHPCHPFKPQPCTDFHGGDARGGAGMSKRMTAAVRAYYEQRWPPRALLTALEGRPDAIAMAMVSELLTELRAVEAENATLLAQMEAARARIKRIADGWLNEIGCRRVAREALAELQPQPEPVRDGTP